MEVDGHLAGTALLSFTPNAGYVGLVQVAAPEEDLSAAADALERYAKRLSKYPVSRSYEGFAESANAGDPQHDRREESRPRLLGNAKQ